MGTRNPGSARVGALLALALAAALLGSCGREPEPAAGAPVVVFAASSLKDLVDGIAAEWRQRTGRAVQARFDATSTLARQIAEGAPADLFLSAAPEWLDRVGCIERRDWLGNRLVLVARREAADPRLDALASLALANEQVPAGKYARAALAARGIALPARTLYGSNVRDVLAKVSQGGAEAGIVYATDAAIDREVRVAFVFPESDHPPIVYAAGLLQPRGKELFDALGADWAQAIARRLGFLVRE